jgi:hypothetical protein
MLLLRGSCEALKALINVLVFLQDEEQAAQAVPIPAFFPYCWLILHQALSIQYTCLAI